MSALVTFTRHSSASTAACPAIHKAALSQIVFLSLPVLAINTLNISKIGHLACSAHLHFVKSLTVQHLSFIIQDPWLSPLKLLLVSWRLYTAAERCLNVAKQFKTPQGNYPNTSSSSGIPSESSVMLESGLTVRLNIRPQCFPMSCSQRTYFIWRPRK